MSKEGPRNLAASVRARLGNIASARAENLQLVLTRFAIERFLHRLERAGHGQEFVLKGAMLFVVHAGWPYRPTRDLDLLKLGEASAESLAAVVREACICPVENDALRFDPDSVRVQPIRDDQEYQGQRVEVLVYLDRARIRLQIDIGFGDAVVPPPDELVYPSLLGFPTPRIRAYPQEAVVAEKVQALVALGAINSRMKDYYDLWALSTKLAFKGDLLAQALRATFERRKTPLPDAQPPGLTSNFAAEHEGMWQGFLRRASLGDGAPELAAVVGDVSTFVVPPLAAVRTGTPFGKDWPPGGPWMTAKGRRD